MAIPPALIEKGIKAGIAANVSSGKEIANELKQIKSEGGWKDGSGVGGFFKKVGRLGATYGLAHVQGLGEGLGMDFGLNKVGPLKDNQPGVQSDFDKKQQEAAMKSFNANTSVASTNLNQGNNSGIEQVNASTNPAFGSSVFAPEDAKMMSSVADPNQESQPLPIGNKQYTT
jgi:hypothetical protein